MDPNGGHRPWKGPCVQQPPKPMASKDPQEEHLSYRNWRLETSSAALEMGVSNNQKWGPPQNGVKTRNLVVTTQK